VGEASHRYDTRCDGPSQRRPSQSIKSARSIHSDAHHWRFRSH
jgi:hypothetical protein